MQAVPGSEVEAKCRARRDAGKIDALPINWDECPDCIEDARESERRNARMCGEFGCPFLPLLDGDEDKCADGCMSAKAARNIPDSPHEGQLRGITATPGIERHVSGVTLNGRPLFVP